MKIPGESGDFEITDVLLQAWTIRFPAADLKREFPLMVLWLAKNPSKRPKNAIRFVENWLRREQASAVKRLNETTKAGQITAERVGARYNVVAHPGESQESFNRRVIAACAGSIIRRVA